MIIFFELLRVNNGCESENDFFFFIFLFFFRQRPTAQMAQSGWNTIAIRHVDQIDELFFIVLDVEIEKFDEEAMNS